MDSHQEYVAACDKTVCTESSVHMHHFSSSNTDSEEQCYAVAVIKGFTDFTVKQVNCTINYYAAIYCTVLSKTDTLDSELSDITVSRNLHSGFFTLRHHQTCDTGWFRINKTCVRIAYWYSESPFDIIEMSNVCKGLGSILAHQIFIDKYKPEINDETHDFRTRTSGLEWFIETMGPLVTRYQFSGSMRKFFIGANVSNTLLRNGIFFLMKQYFVDIDFQPNVLWHFDYYRFMRSTNSEHPMRFVLCEKELSNSQISLPKCSAIYNSCFDGTCVHDALWCDGEQHCSQGEDEQHCKHVCSVSNINCMLECHVKDECKCIDNYFQCLSGGCIPLQKFCDKTLHCEDGSDEPSTCIYDNMYNVVNYVNRLVQNVQKDYDKCFQYLTTDAENLLLPSETVETSNCHNNSVLSSHIVYGQCSEQISLSAPGEFSRDVFPLHLVCVFPTECQPVCRNGFHLKYCRDMHCVGHFKCPKSYCVSLQHVCNGLCECTKCEDEEFCQKLLCPGLLLAERLGSGLYCSHDFMQLKTALNRRQMVETNALSVTDKYPVFIKLYSNLSAISKKWQPQLVTHFSVKSSWTTVDLTIFNKMVSIIYLGLSDNKINQLPSDSFITMSLLIVLDISNNKISHLSGRILCPLMKLKYLFANNNGMRYLDRNAFKNNLELELLMLHSNKLHVGDTQFLNVPNELRLSLKYLSSDLPRLCCVFENTIRCTPDMPVIISCSNLISSKSQVIVAWLIGVITVSLNTGCVISLLMFLFFKGEFMSRKGVVLFTSVNRSIAELITSVCLLSYPCINMYFDKVFGVIADQWRSSWQCIGLEFFFFISSQACLTLSLFMSIHFTLNIASLIPNKKDPRKVLTMLVIWSLLLGISSAWSATQVSISSNPFNYFCLPFVTIIPDKIELKIVYYLLIIIDGIMVCSSVSCYTFLFAFTRKRIRDKSLKAVKKGTRVLWKFTFRMAMVIFSDSLTWTPILLMQILVLAGIDIDEKKIMWILLTCLPVNLMIDPIFIIRNLTK